MRLKEKPNIPQENNFARFIDPRTMEEFPEVVAELGTLISCPPPSSAAVQKGRELLLNAAREKQKINKH